MNKLVGLCICYHVDNYGSVLQALATQKAIENLGYDYEIIRYSKKKGFVFYLKKLPLLFSKTLYYVIRRRLSIKLQSLKSRKYKDSLVIRRNAFRNFADKWFIKKSDVFRDYSSLVTNARKYDSVLVGSDQLWNPMGFSTNFYNLMFVPEEINKISYATSFGVTELPNFHAKKAKRFLKRINYLSVREIGGAELINRIDRSIRVEVVLDPTLLVEKKEWDQMLSNSHNKPFDNYIFCYFLGTSPESRESAKKLKEKTGLPIVTIKHEDEYYKLDENFGDFSPEGVSPSSFLDLIRNADYVLTDSFHGTIFSLINHKQFLTFYRFKKNDKNSRNSRIDSLFGLLDISNRLFNGDVDSIFLPIDYDSVDQKVSDLRSKSLLFLSKSLNKESI